MPTIITRGAASARGYGFGASKASGGTPFPNTFYQYAFGGSYPCSVPSGTNRFYVNGTLKFSQSGTGTNGCGSVGASSQNIMSFGFYYGNYSPHMFDNELGTRKDASASYGGWYSTPYVAICSKSIVMYCQGWIFGGTLYRSTDGGVTYTTYGSFSGNMQAMHARGTTVFVSTYNSGNNYYYVSTDSGATWTSSGITGLPSSTPNSNPYSFSVYLNGKHNLWIQSGSSSTYNYYTSTNALSWTFIGSVTGNPGNINPSSSVWYYNGYYYSSIAGSTYDNIAGYRSSDGYTWATFGVKPSLSGFGYRQVTATSSGLVMSYSGYCCSGSSTPPAIWITSSFSPTSSGCWSQLYSYSYTSFGPLRGIRGYNQDQG